MKWLSAGEITVFASLFGLSAAITCRQCDANGAQKAADGQPITDCTQKLVTDVAPLQLTACTDPAAVYCKLDYVLHIPESPRWVSMATSGCANANQVMPGYEPRTSPSVFSCQRFKAQIISDSPGGFGFSCLCKNGPDGKACNNYDFNVLKQAFTAMSALQSSSPDDTIMSVVDMANVGSTSFASLQTMAPFALWGSNGKAIPIDASFISAAKSGVTVSTGQNLGGSGATTTATSTKPTTTNSTADPNYAMQLRPSVVGVMLAVTLYMFTVIQK